MKILAIDFNSLMNRSFYAIRHLSNREGFPKCRIRPLPRRLLPEALALCQTVFSQSEAAKETASIPDFPEPQQAAQMAATGLLRFFGAFSGKTLIGVSALKEKQHISLLFVRTDFQRCGVGSALLSAMEKRIRTRAASVNASLSAVPFYRSRGYRCCGEEYRTGGIRLIPLERILRK